MPTSSAFDEQRIRDTNHVRLRLCLEPREEFIQFARLSPLLAAQHGEQHVANVGRARAGGPARGPSQQLAGRQQVPQPIRRLSEQRGFLFEINVDAAEENGRAGALVFLVEGERQVERHHRHVVAHPPELGHQRVVAETVPAIHRAGAGGDLDEIHREARPAKSRWYRFSSKSGSFGSRYNRLVTVFVSPGARPPM